MELPFRWSYAAALRLTSSSTEDVVLTIQVNDPDIGEAAVGYFHALPEDEKLLDCLRKYGLEIEQEKEKECQTKTVSIQSLQQDGHQLKIGDKKFTARICKGRIFGTETFILDVLQNILEDPTKTAII